MIDLLPLFSTMLLIPKLPTILAKQLISIVNHAYWKGTRPNNVYWNDVLNAVNTPMKLEVAVEILGSSPITKRMGPMSNPPAIPKDPARIPAMKHIQISLMYVGLSHTNSSFTLLLKRDSCSFLTENYVYIINNKLNTIYTPNVTQLQSLH